ncbi:MAG: hypothetical protein ACI8QZ_002602 [Chlamydiales bacterium]|jgi:hypothetical protein
MNRIAIVIVALAWMTSACRSSSKGTEAPGPRVEWGVDDVHSISKGLVEDLLGIPEVSALAGTARGDDMRVPAYMAGIANGTNVPIAGEALVDALERLLVGSGRFRFVTADEESSAKGPRWAPNVTAERAREAGAELGADVAIYTVFRALDPGHRAPGAPGYALVLNCVDIKGGGSDWNATREVSRSDADFFRVR